jgi:hypothetical protein
VKFKLLEVQSTDAGSYGGLHSFDWDGNVVEGSWCNDKRNSIYVSGKEFILCGGSPEAFNTKLSYMWGCFEELVI